MKHESVQSQPGDLDTCWRDVIKRRSFLAGLSATGAAISARELAAGGNHDRLPRGDVAIIKFLTAAELVDNNITNSVE